MSIFSNDDIPIQKILNCQNAHEAAELINAHSHFSVGFGAGKSIHAFTSLERKLASLILQSTQQRLHSDTPPAPESGK